MDEVIWKRKAEIQRVLLKVSGEALGVKMAEVWISMLSRMCAKRLKVFGAGCPDRCCRRRWELLAGCKDGGGVVEQVRADHMGMMATVLNCLALADVLEQMDVPVRVQTAIEMRAVAEPL